MGYRDQKQKRRRAPLVETFPVTIRIDDISMDDLFIIGHTQNNFWGVDRKMPRSEMRKSNFPVFDQLLSEKVKFGHIGPKVGLK